MYVCVIYLNHTKTKGVGFMGNKVETSKDTMTGCRSYEGFIADFEGLIGEANESRKEISLVMLDIDQFKRINDDYGHQAGDEIIKSLARHLFSHIKDSYLIYRYSGDQFAIIMPDTEKECAFLLMEKIRETLTFEDLQRQDNKEFKIKTTISAGISSFPDDGNRVAEVVRKAEGALYRAKSSGRNKVCLSREEKMITKTTHYTYEQLQRLAELAKEEGIGEAMLLREALDDLLKKYDV